MSFHELDPHATSLPSLPSCFRPVTIHLGLSTVNRDNIGQTAVWFTNPFGNEPLESFLEKGWAKVVKGPPVNMDPLGFEDYGNPQ